MTRVVVFIDYQNLYHSAREMFADPTSAPPAEGHVHPVQLGTLLTDRGKSVDPARELTEVRVYRGQPGPKSHRHLVAAFNRQVAHWRTLNQLTVRTRPLRYQPTDWNQGRPVAWKAEEKGIDVMIALDIALGTRDKCFDVAVVVSADTDLIPPWRQPWPPALASRPPRGPDREPQPGHLPFPAADYGTTD